MEFDERLECVNSERYEAFRHVFTAQLSNFCEGYTKADLIDLAFDAVTILYGIVPDKSTDSAKQRVKRAMNHRQKEAQLIQISRKLADMIKEDVSLVRRAKDHIDRLLKEDQGQRPAT